LRSAEWSHWQEAIDTEYKSLQERQTWSLVVKLAGRKIVDNKWVFKIKRTIARYKARLVARGFTQEHGIDYTAKFSGTRH
jgi:NAD dependent epimerase/dehydratase family enzyme